jgi:hypothetical protein
MDDKERWRKFFAAQSNACLDAVINDESGERA